MPMTAVAGRSIPANRRWIVKGCVVVRSVVNVISSSHFRFATAIRRKMLLDFFSSFHACAAEDARIAVVRVDILNNAIHLPRSRIATSRFLQQKQVFVIFQTLTNQFQTHTIDRNVLCAADSFWAARIKESSVSVAAK